MELITNMTWLGAVVIATGALLIAVVIQFVGQPHFTYEWIATGIAAFIGGVIGSEYIVGLRTFEPVWEGVALLPALAGGLVFGLVIAALSRLLPTGQQPWHRPV